MHYTLYSIIVVICEKDSCTDCEIKFRGRLMLSTFTVYIIAFFTVWYILCFWLAWNHWTWNLWDNARRTPLVKSRDQGRWYYLRIYKLAKVSPSEEKRKKNSRPRRSLRLETKMYQLVIIPLHIIHTIKV